METHSITIPIISLLPFVLMLLTIAIFPLFWNHFWEKNSNKLIIVAVLSFPIVIYLFFAGLEEKLIETIVFDYIPFIILLGSLFTITGGIYLSGDIEANHRSILYFIVGNRRNSSLFDGHYRCCNVINKTGYSNKQRKFKVHTILFFIGIIANCGGLLTPLGDPPLFMMYLRGAPFEWFLTLMPEWFTTNFLLLVLYYVFDRYYYKREQPEDIRINRTSIRPIKIEGKINFYWLLCVVLSVAFLNEQYFEFIKTNQYYKFI